LVAYRKRGFSTELFFSSSYDKRVMMTATQNSLILDAASSATAYLPQWGLILVEGVDAASFLQSQLTNSILGLKLTKPPQIAQSHESVRLVGYCSPKGRLLASAWIGLFPCGEDAVDRFALFISKDLAAPTAKRLNMYVLRSKVTVTDVSANWNIFGLYGSQNEVDHLLGNDDHISLRIPDVLLAQQSFGRVLIAKPNTNPDNPSNAPEVMWNYLEVISAIPRIVFATQEQFVPQMINFESVSGVDFKKGCYPGQEIVARSQYRGVIKRRLQLAHVVDQLAGSAIDPGTELFLTHEPEQPAGMVVLSAQNPLEPTRFDLQIECKLDALEAGEIHLASVTGPVLKIDPLPYPLIEI
jgi:tRNA-modifying protein YgfZ